MLILITALNNGINVRLSWSAKYLKSRWTGVLIVGFWWWPFTVCWFRSLLTSLSLQSQITIRAISPAAVTAGTIPMVLFPPESSWNVPVRLLVESLMCDCIFIVYFCLFYYDIMAGLSEKLLVKLVTVHVPSSPHTHTQHMQTHTYTVHTDTHTRTPQSHAHGRRRCKTTARSRLQPRRRPTLQAESFFLKTRLFC